MRKFSSIALRPLSALGNYLYGPLLVEQGLKTVAYNLMIVYDQHSYCHKVNSSRRVKVEKCYEN